MAVGYKHLPVDVYLMDFFFKDNIESHHWAFIYLLLIKMIDSFASNIEKGFPPWQAPEKFTPER